MEDSYERIFRETGIPNPMIRGEPGASAAAYPNGLLRDRIAKRLPPRLRRLLHRVAPK